MEKLLIAMEAFLSYPIVWGVVALVAGGVALSGRLSVGAASVVLWIALGAAVFGTFQATGQLKSDPVIRYLIWGAISCALTIGCVLLIRWCAEKPLLQLESKRTSATTQPPIPSGKAPIRTNIAANLIIDTVSDQYINFHFQVENAVNSRVINNVRYSIKTPDALQKEFVPPMARTLQPGGKLSLSVPPFFLHSRDYNSVLLTLMYAVDAEGVQHEFTSTYRFFFDRSRAKEGNVIDPEELRQQEVNSGSPSTTGSPTPSVDQTDLLPPVTTERSPGESLQIHIRINSLAGKRRKYLFDFGNVAGPRFSIYISPDNVFKVSFTDPNRETYSVQVPLGSGGIPVGDFIFLTCEIGVGAQTSVLRVLLDGKPIVINDKDAGFLELPFRVDVAALDVPNGVVGADLNGTNGASIDVLELSMYSATLRDGDIQGLRQYFNGRPHTPFVQFNGRQWMRVKDVGAHDLEQTDKAHRPIFRSAGP